MNNPNYSLRILLRTLIFSFALIFTLHTTAQTQEINSYIQKSRRNFRNLDSLNFYGSLLIQFNDSTAKAEGYYALSHAKRRINQIDSSLSFSLKSEKWIPNTNYNLQERVTRSIASAYAQTRDFDNAIQYADSLLKIASISKNERMKMTAYFLKGMSLSGLQDYEDAIKLLIQSAEVAQEIKDINGEVNAYTNIALTYGKFNQVNLATPWFQKAYYTSLKDKRGQFTAMTTTNLTAHYLTIKQKDSSQFYLNKLLDIVPQLTPDRKKMAFMRATKNYIEYGNLELAMTYLNRAKEMKIRGKVSSITAHQLHLEHQIKMKEGDFIAGEKLIDSIYNLTINDKISRKNFMFLLDKAEAQRKQNKYKEALESFELYNKYKDSITDENNFEIVKNSIDSFDLENKERSLRDALEENKTSKTTIILLSIFGILIIVALIFVFKRYLNSKSREEELEKKHQEILISFKKLQDQIAENKKPDAPDSILINSKQVVKLDQLEYVKSEGHYLDYFINGESLPLTERYALKDRINELEKGGFLQVHRSFVININQVRAIHSGMVIMETGNKIPLSRTYKQRLKEEEHPLFS